MTLILVVDDEPLIRELIEEMLLEEGYAVILANDGREMLTLLEEVRPHLILVDAMMPVLDGREAVRRMRDRAELAAVPVVMMSAGWRPAANDIAIADFLAKPFDLDHLLDTVTSHAPPPPG